MDHLFHSKGNGFLHQNEIKMIKCELSHLILFVGAKGIIVNPLNAVGAIVPEFRLIK